MPNDILRIAGREFHSRLIVGTGKYKSFQEMVRAHEASGAEIVTVAVRRVNLNHSGTAVAAGAVDMALARVRTTRRIARRTCVEQRGRFRGRVALLGAWAADVVLPGAALAAGRRDRALRRRNLRDENDLARALQDHVSAGSSTASAADAIEVDGVAAAATESAARDDAPRGADRDATERDDAQRTSAASTTSADLVDRA